MKSKFGSFDFGSVEVLSRAETAKVKGGAYGAGSPSNTYTPPYSGNPGGGQGPGNAVWCMNGTQISQQQGMDCQATYGSNCSATISWSGSCKTSGQL